MKKHKGGIEKQLIWRKRIKIEKEQTHSICNFLTDGKYSDLTSSSKRRTQKKKKSRVDEEEVELKKSPSSPNGGDLFENTRYSETMNHFSSQWTITQDDLARLSDRVTAEHQEKQRNDRRREELVFEQIQREKERKNLTQTIQNSRKTITALSELLQQSKSSLKSEQQTHSTTDTTPTTIKSSIAAVHPNQTTTTSSRYTQQQHLVQSDNNSSAMVTNSSNISYNVGSQQQIPITASMASSTGLVMAQNLPDHSSSSYYPNPSSVSSHNISTSSPPSSQQQQQHRYNNHHSNPGSNRYQQPNPPPPPHHPTIMGGPMVPQPQYIPSVHHYHGHGYPPPQFQYHMNNSNNQQRRKR